MIRRLLSLALLTLAAGIPAFAGPGFSSMIDGVQALDFPLVRVSLRVFTPEPIELTADQFTLTERQDRIATFSVEMSRREPFIALLLDRSSSMEPVIGQVRDSAATFIRGLGKSTRTALLTFASDVDLVQDFTGDQEPLLKGVAVMRPWGGTALYDGLFRAIEQLRSGAQRDDQKTLVLLTDGKDESPQGKPGFSIKKPQEVFEHAARNGIRVICVGLGTSLDTEFLTRLAKETHGVFLQAPSAAQLQSVFVAISRRMMLERRYHLTYTTPDPRRDGSRRDLRITSECKGQKDQGTGFYLAPTDPAPGRKPEATPKTAGQPGSQHLKTDLELGRLNSPDLGSATRIDHLPRGQLATYTPIATLSADNAAAQPGIDTANQTIEEVNRNNQALFEQNQKMFDQQIDDANKVIDAANQQSQEAHEDAQRRADEITESANQALEEAEQAGQTDVEIPDPGSDATTEPEEPDSSDADE